MTKKCVTKFVYTLVYNFTNSSQDFKHFIKILYELLSTKNWLITSYVWYIHAWRFVNVRNKLLIKVTKIQSIIYFLKIKLIVDNFLIKLQKRNYILLLILNLNFDWVKNAKTWVRSLEKIKKLDQIKLNSSSFFWLQKVWNFVS